MSYGRQIRDLNDTLTGRVIEHLEKYSKYEQV